MEKIFQLKENHTSVKTEIIAGLTTFMTMAYILALNPNILTNYTANGGQELWNAVFVATCVASAIGMFCMAFLANKPFCLAPGMGLNSFFAVTVTGLTDAGVGYLAGFQAMLLVIVFEGILFLILTLCNIREKIVHAIPAPIRMGITPAIGLMLLNIGLGSNVYIADSGFNQFYVMQDFFGSLTAIQAAASMTDAYPTMVLSVITMFVGLFFIVFLTKKGVKGSVILGILLGAVIYWAGEALFLGTNPFAALSEASWIPAFADLGKLTLLKFNFATMAKIGWITIITLLVTFCMIDMFDTIGTLVGTAFRANMVDENGDMPKMKQALLADAVGTIAGGLMGTSTVTTYVESASGVEAGGRTGLTSLTCGIMFLICLFLAPIAKIIPAAATSSALIYVGVLMMGSLKSVDFNRLEVAVPVALMLIAMPVSGSIGNAIGIGLISYTVITLLDGKPKEISPLTYVLSVLFLIKFFFVA